MISTYGANVMSGHWYQTIFTGQQSIFGRAQLKQIKWMMVLAVLLIANAAFADETSQKNTESATINAAAPDFTLTDSQGKTHNLSDYRGKYVILEWVNYDCPFVRKHYGSGNMQQLQKKYTEDGVVWLSICSSAPGKQGHFSGDALAERIKKENAAMTAYLIDENGNVGRMYRAKTTPHMYVINPEGVLLYAGAIDDKPSANVADIETATNYLTAAMTAATEGQPVANATTKPYGCAVKY